MKRVPGPKVYRLLYPQVPAVVAAYHKGVLSAMPAVSVVALSNEPPLVGVSSSPSHSTYGTIAKARCFSLSWLDERYAGAVEKLGSSTGAEVEDKIGGAGLNWTLKKEPQVPLLREASAFAVCRVVEAPRYGDHRLIVAEVSEAGAIGDFRDYWTFETYHPILYTGTGRPPSRTLAA